MKKVLFALTMSATILFCQDIYSQDLQQIMGQITDPTKAAKFESDYKFDAFIQMEMTNFVKGGSESDKILYDSYMTKGGGTYALVFTQEGMPMSIIFDKENNSLLLLTEGGGEKTGMAMAVNPEAIAALSGGPAEDSEEEPYESSKTGKTKSILGYSCNEYLIDEGSGEIRVWASEQLGKEVGKEMLGNQKAFGGALSHAVFVNGMVMEYDFHDKDSGEKMVMKVTKLEMSGSHTISTSGFNVMSLGQFQ
jgi:hypothetical protein